MKAETQNRNHQNKKNEYYNTEYNTITTPNSQA